MCPKETGMGDETAKKLWFLLAGRNLVRMFEVSLQPREKATCLDKRGLPILPAVGWFVDLEGCSTEVRMTWDAVVALVIE